MYLKSLGTIALTAPPEAPTLVTVAVPTGELPAAVLLAVLDKVTDPLAVPEAVGTGGFVATTVTPDTTLVSAGLYEVDEKPHCDMI